MREILFRAKRVGKDEWVYGSYAYQYGCHEILLEACESEYGFDHYSVDPDTVGQYTGLYEIGSHKRIFEGDILRFSYTGTNRGVNGIAPVVFDNGKFGVRWGWHKELVALDGFANTTIEVIGNIHDNPELLGERKENG